MARYAISDIHGCLKTFKKALAEIKLSTDDTLIIVGDLIDRGPKSAELIDFILDLIYRGFNIIVLLGNHEDFMLKSYDEETKFPNSPYGRATNEIFKSWMMNGGRQTLLSYGFDINGSKPIGEWKSTIPKKHIDWLRELDIIYVTDDYVFVHGGLDFHQDDPICETSEDTALWTRIYRIPGSDRKPLIGGRVLVTGHTPTDKETMCEMANGEDLITIDRGCIFNSSEYGHLAVLNLDTKQFRFIKNMDCEE